MSVGEGVSEGVNVLVGEGVSGKIAVGVVVDVVVGGNWVLVLRITG